MKKKAVFIFTLIFFAVMLLFTLTARSIHNASIPHVSARRLTNQIFTEEFADENGDMQTLERYSLAIDRELYESGNIYVLTQTLINGEYRDTARLAHIETGAEAGRYIEVISGLNPVDRIITDAKGELYDGCEVVVVK